LRDQVQIEAEERGAQPHAGSSHSGFTTGVPGAYHYNVVLFRKRHNTSILER
jgi:hypothetical protein